MPVKLVPQMVTKTITVKFEEIGYPGWEATLWLNPPAYIYNDFIATKTLEDGRRDSDDDRNFKALKEIVLDWNLLDRGGKVVPLPKEWVSPEEGIEKLPVEIWSFLMRSYFEEFNRLTAVVPKAYANGSGTTS